MTKDEAIRRVVKALPMMQGTNAAAEFVDALVVLEVLKLDPPLRFYVECDCTCADVCPQGRAGFSQKCRIVKRPQ